MLVFSKNGRVGHFVWLWSKEFFLAGIFARRDIAGSTNSGIWVFGDFLFIVSKISFVVVTFSSPLVTVSVAEISCEKVSRP